MTITTDGTSVSDNVNYVGGTTGIDGSYYTYPYYPSYPYGWSYWTLPSRDQEIIDRLDKIIALLSGDDEVSAQEVLEAVKKLVNDD